MSDIIGKRGEPFYNLSAHQLVSLKNKVIRHLVSILDHKGLQLSMIMYQCVIFVLNNLAQRRRACMYNFEFVSFSSSGLVRVTRALSKHMMIMNNSLVYAEEGGWKDMTIDIDKVCIESEKTMNSKNQIVIDIDQKRASAFRNLDFTGFINVTTEASFQTMCKVDETLSSVCDFKFDLTRVAKLNFLYHQALRDAEYYESIHHLNRKTHIFKPWKLYSCKPVYPYCMSPMSYDDDPLRTEFDANFVMPEDVGRIITKFVGYEFISNVKYGLIIAAKGRDAIRNKIKLALEKWRKNELLNFAHAVSYNYIKVSHSSNLSHSSNAFVISPSSNKTSIINELMTNFECKELYYPFYRDVMILTPILKKQRKVVRAKKNGS